MARYVIDARTLLHLVDHRLTLREAEYLSVTRLQADALVTFDPALAAKADGIVTVAPLQALLSAES